MIAFAAALRHGPLAWVRARLFAPIDIAGLAAFRVLFGALMAHDAASSLALGRVHTHYVAPALLLRYPGLEWVGAPPAPVLHGVFALMAGTGVAIALGWRYRIAAALSFAAHTWVFLLSATRYLNHAYLVCVLSLVMIFLPAHRALSLDARRRPAILLRRIHAWPVAALTGLLAIVYVYGGVAKLDPDWLAGIPARQWLAQSARQVAFGGSVVLSEPFLWLVVHGGAAFDLLVPWALLWRRTRAAAFGVSILFHLVNAQLFEIGVFPPLMIAATTLFLDPSWPRDHLGALGRRIDRGLGAGADPPAPAPRERALVEIALAAFLAVQLLLPLRHHLYPGDVGWTEEGHYLSWRMKLRDKRGRCRFLVHAPADGRSWAVDPASQMPAADARILASKPDLILAYAHYLRDGYRTHERLDVEVRAECTMSLNFRPEQRFVDPEVDLAAVDGPFLPRRFILPLRSAD